MAAPGGFRFGGAFNNPFAPGGNDGQWAGAYVGIGEKNLLIDFQVVSWAAKAERG